MLQPVKLGSTPSGLQRLGRRASGGWQRSFWRYGYSFLSIIATKYRSPRSWFWFLGWWSPTTSARGSAQSWMGFWRICRIGWRFVARFPSRMSRSLETTRSIPYVNINIVPVILKDNYGRIGTTLEQTQLPHRLPLLIQIVKQTPQSTTPHVSSRKYL